MKCACKCFVGWIHSIELLIQQQQHHIWDWQFRIFQTLKRTWLITYIPFLYHECENITNNDNNKYNKKNTKILNHNFVAKFPYFYWTSLVNFEYQKIINYYFLKNIFPAHKHTSAKLYFIYMWKEGNEE